jgi:hypothetical protein
MCISSIILQAIVLSKDMRRSQDVVATLEVLFSGIGPVVRILAPYHSQVGMKHRECLIYFSRAAFAIDDFLMSIIACILEQTRPSLLTRKLLRSRWHSRMLSSDAISRFQRP